MFDEKHAFLADGIFSTTLMAVTQRGRLYRKHSSDCSRENFRRALRSRLANLANRYWTSVPEDQHVSHIESLANDLSAECAEALQEGRLRIGSAQKH
jgi:hypothetical protein